MDEKIVGILGGMGPEATVDFIQRIIRLTTARDDCDHIRMLIDNNPKVPSRIKAIVEKTGQNPAPVLINMARGLEKQGADFLVIPCNTAHYYYQDVVSAVQLPVFNMIELTIEKIVAHHPGIHQIGLLASTAVVVTGLFTQACKKREIQLIYPPEELQHHVLESIKQVKAGHFGDQQVEYIQQAADHLIQNNVEVIIIGCTELSVLANRIESTVQLYDSSQILAEKVVTYVKSEV